MKIVVVVVTYNRLNLLKECIEALRNQTHKLDEIFVINNSSTDGTFEWLAEQKDLTVITQPNSGGAGGFHTGMKKAYEAGYDWIWCMDDDCLPNLNALEKLICDLKNKNSVYNSTVLVKDDKVTINFGIEDYETKKFYSSFNQIKEKKYINGANFFNGTIISRNVIDKIGLPYKEFFIYCDELEYYFRILHADCRIVTIPCSIVLHPLQKHKYIGKWKFFYRLIWFNELGVKYFPRNLMAVWYLYSDFTLRRLIKTYIFDLFGLIFYQKKISFVFKYLRSILTAPLFIFKNYLNDNH